MASENVSFTINEDGTITRKTSQSSTNNDSDNSGCLWSAVIVSCLIIIIAVIMYNTADSQTYGEYNDYSAEVVDSAYEAVEEVVEVVEDASYLSLSETDVYFDADGGSVSIDVDTDGDWDIGTYPYDWGHLTLYNNSITLTVDSYDGDSDREDWFTVKAGVHEVRVDITQWAEVIEVVDSIDYEVIEEVIAE